MATLTDDPLALTMRAVGIEVTRDGYIRAAYGDNDIPKSWTPEHEMELPEELQDWTLFPPELALWSRPMMRRQRRRNRAQRRQRAARRRPARIRPNY